MGNHAFREKNGSRLKSAIIVERWLTFRETVLTRRNHPSLLLAAMNVVEAEKGMTVVAEETTVAAITVVAAEMTAVDSGTAIRRISRRLS